MRVKETRSHRFESKSIFLLLTFTHKMDLFCCLFSVAVLASSGSYSDLCDEKKIFRAEVNTVAGGWSRKHTIYGISISLGSRMSIVGCRAPHARRKVRANTFDTALTLSKQDYTNESQKRSRKEWNIARTHARKILEWWRLNAKPK